MRALPKTAFKKGCAPGPGRPPGKRNYLTEVVLEALANDFNEHGLAVIEKVRREKPHVYLQACVSLLPKQMHVERSSPLGELSDDELLLLEEHLAATRAKLVQKLELEPRNGAENGAQSFPPASPRIDDFK